MENFFLKPTRHFPFCRSSVHVLIRMKRIYNVLWEGQCLGLTATWKSFLSPPVHMHGGLICITLRLDVTGPKRLHKNSFSRKCYICTFKTYPQYRRSIGALNKKYEYALRNFFSQHVILLLDRTEPKRLDKNSYLRFSHNIKGFYSSVKFKTG